VGLLLVKAADVETCARLDSPESLRKFLDEVGGFRV
jgi:hypothetical protein